MTDTKANTALTADLVRLPQMSRLALCVGDGILDVVVTSKVEDNSLIWRRIPLSGASGPMTRALEETVYDNPLLLAPFSHTDIVFDTRRFLVVPADRATDDRAEAMLETLYPNVEFEPLINEIPGNAVIAAAVAMAMEAAGEENTTGFVVRSIRRINNAPAWNRAGREEQVYSRM